MNNISNIDKNNNSNNFRARIEKGAEYKEKRVCAKVSGADLARRLNIPASYIYAIEAGERVVQPKWKEAYDNLKPAPTNPPWKYVELKLQLKNLREARNLTIDEAAKLIGAARCDMVLWETGFIIPDKRSLTKYAKIGGSPKQLLAIRAYDLISCVGDVIINIVKTGDGSMKSIIEGTGIKRNILSLKLATMVKAGCLDRKRNGPFWIYRAL